MTACPGLAGEIVSGSGMESTLLWIPCSAEDSAPALSKNEGGFRNPTNIGDLSRMTILPSNRLFLVCLVLLSVGCSRNTQPASTGPQLSLMYNTEEQATEKTVTAQVIQSQLKEKGIPVTLEPVTNAVFYDRIAKADYQAALALWYVDYDDPEGFLTDFYSKAGFRMAKYSNPAYDDLYERGL